MKDIKTRELQRGTIKTLQRNVKMLDRTIRSGENVIKEAAEPAATPTADPAAEMSQYAQNTEAGAARFAGRKMGRDAACLVRSSAREAFHVKQRSEAAKASIKTAKQSIKTAGQTMKAGAKQVQATIKAGQASIKAASASVKTAQTAQATAAAVQKTAAASAHAAHAAAQAAVHAARVSIHAAVVAVKATAHAISAAVQTIASAIATGGWSAVIIILVVILAVALIAIICCSAAGVFSGDETDGNTLQSVQAELNEEFREQLEAQKRSLSGYDQVTVRPAEVITEWNNIIAVYSVRAQLAGRAAGEMSEENIELLRETLWDMISFSASEEAVTVPESGNTAESAEEETTGGAQTVGVVTVNYLTLSEAYQLYDFSEDDQEMTVLVLQMAVGGGILGSGNGMMINPCPDGTFNGNDYPAYPSGGYHAGRDIACPIGTPVYAAASGTVIHINDQADTYGNHIMIAHGNEVYTLYAHCSELLVSVGDTVTQGQLIALSGNTGNTTGPHLHFEVRAGGSQYRVNNVDPLEWIG